MKKKLLVLLFSLASLALVACGGGNDVASSGATPVSAAAPTTKPDATTSTPVSTPTTETKINGQIDERTGVAPVAAQMTIVPKPTGSYGCFESSTGDSAMYVVDFGANTMNGTYINDNGLFCTHSISFTFSGGPIYHAQGAGNIHCSGGNETDKVLRVKEASFDLVFNFMFIDSGRTLNLQFYQNSLIPSVCQRQ